MERIATTASPSKWLTLIAACLGLIMLYIDLFIVNVALPAIGHDFRAPLGTVSWAISGYVLMIGVLPMGMGRLGDLWGQRAVYLGGLVIFSISATSARSGYWHLWWYCRSGADRWPSAGRAAGAWR
jgi:DHA2 family methylenomycin A resistance protein-like MFS transporter